MKLIVNYNPAIGTFNLGDEIISDSIFNEMHQIYQNAFQVNISTHYEIPKCFADAVSKSKYKFVLGTNLLRNNISDFWPIYTELGPMILIGCCWKPEEVKTSDNGAEMYKSVLSKEYIHSVRDSYTEKRLKDIGLLNVINTGCPTIWKFNQSFCNLIPRKKADSVIFTLTDYRKDPIYDMQVFNILKMNYNKVYLWLQGYGDFEYGKQLEILDTVQIIPHNLKIYDSFLENNNVDYIGTRLHGGIRALQKKKRTLILATDYRARNMYNDFRLPIVEREQIDLIRDFIQNEYITNININHDGIAQWKHQFEELR